MSGGGGSTTTTQKADPWEGVQPYLKDAFANFVGQGSQTPSYYPGQTYAGFQPMQEEAMSGMMDYAGGPQLGGMIGNAQDALNFGLTSYQDPESNPVIGKYVESAIRPLTQAYKGAVGNTIAGNAVGAGGLGGSRQGVAEGLATQSYLDAAGDVSSGIYQDAYGKGLDAMKSSMAMSPMMAQFGQMPYDIANQVGGAYQGMDQNAINEAMQRYGFNQDAGFNRAGSILNTLQGTPWGQSSSTGPNPNQSNPLSNMMGGAMGGGALGGMLGAAPLSAGLFAPPLLPFMLGGAALGGLLG